MGIVESSRSLKERKEGKEIKEKRKGKTELLSLESVGGLFTISGHFLGVTFRGELGQLSHKVSELSLKNWQRFSKNTLTLEVRLCSFFSSGFGF